MAWAGFNTLFISCVPTADDESAKHLDDGNGELGEVGCLQYIIQYNVYTRTAIVADGWELDKEQPTGEPFKYFQIPASASGVLAHTPQIAQYNANCVMGVCAVRKR